MSSSRNFRTEMGMLLSRFRAPSVPIPDRSKARLRRDIVSHYYERDVPPLKLNG